VNGEILPNRVARVMVCSSPSCKKEYDPCPWIDSGVPLYYHNALRSYDFRLFYATQEAAYKGLAPSSFQEASARAFEALNFDRTDFQAFWCFTILTDHDYYFLPDEMKMAAGEYPFFSICEGIHPIVVFSDACWKNGMKLKHFEHEAALQRDACEVDIPDFWDSISMDYLLVKFSIRLSQKHCKISGKKFSYKYLAPWYGKLSRFADSFKKTERQKASVGLLISQSEQSPKYLLMVGDVVAGCGIA
jgi:hypothetical protein